MGRVRATTFGGKVNANSWPSTMGNVVYQCEYDKGGHFAAHERPEAITQDLVAMFEKRGGAYGVVNGKDGYEKLNARL